jgi:hypothetical protein
MIKRASAVALIAAAACAGEPGVTATEPDMKAVPAAEKGGIPHGRAAAALEAVNAGNAQAIASAPDLVPPGAPLAPFIEARLYAIANVAMHDALNAIEPRFARYADTGPIDADASPAAAVLTAARDAIVGADPAATSATNAWYAAHLSDLVGSAGFSAGVEIGHRAAQAILAMRAGDGTAGGGVTAYTPGTGPGDYRFTFPFNTPGFDFFGTGGFADASEWGQVVTPFVMTSASQFRAPLPYGAATNAERVLTAGYTADFNEVKALGCAACPGRTVAQTEIALFWVENSPTGWNRIAGIVAAQRQLDAWNTARLYALLQMGEFDSYTSSLEAKYYYNFWRPVTAVALADTDGNPSTSTQAGWEVLAFPTPPVPDYPSAHAEAGGTAGAIINALLPGRFGSISTTSGSLPGVTRTFNTIDDAVLENGLSRVYVGYHFRHAAMVGISQGRKVGEYVVQNALKSLKQ